MGSGQRRRPSDPTSADEGFGSVEPIPHGHELVGNAEHFGVAKLGCCHGCFVPVVDGGGLWIETWVVHAELVHAGG